MNARLVALLHPFFFRLDGVSWASRDLSMVMSVVDQTGMATKSSSEQTTLPNLKFFHLDMAYRAAVEQVVEFASDHLQTYRRLSIAHFLWANDGTLFHSPRVFRPTALT